MVNEFKLAVVHFARPNTMQPWHAHGLTAGQNTVENLEPLGRWATGLFLAKPILFGVQT